VSSTEPSGLAADLGARSGGEVVADAVIFGVRRPAKADS
jgi:hypothetical protein